MTIRIVFGVLMVAATALLLTRPIGAYLGRAHAVPWLLRLFIASRIAGWLVTYVVLGDLASYSDLTLYYYPEAEAVVGGLIPYMDFPTSYGPLFPYLSALLMPVWHSRAALAAVLIGFEIAAVLMFVRTARTSAALTSGAIARCLYIYTFNPAALYWSGMLAYNSSVVLFFWVMSTALLARRRYALSLLGQTASVVAGKFLGVLIGPVWLGCARNSYRALAAFAVAAVPVVIALRAAGIDLLLPLQREGGRSTAGNLWFLLTGIVPASTDSTVWQVAPLAMLGLGLATLGVWLFLRWTEPPMFGQIAAGVAACGWLFMLLSRKSYPHYTPMFLLFFALIIGASRRYAIAAVALAVIGAVGIVEPGLWNALGQPASLRTVLESAPAASVMALITADLVLVAGGCWALALCLQSVRPTTAAALGNSGNL